MRRRRRRQSMHAGSLSNRHQPTIGSMIIIITVSVRNSALPLTAGTATNSTAFSATNDGNCLGKKPNFLRNNDCQHFSTHSRILRILLRFQLFTSRLYNALESLEWGTRSGCPRAGGAGARASRQLLRCDFPFAMGVRAKSDRLDRPRRPRPEDDLFRHESSHTLTPNRHGSNRTGEH